MTSDLPQPLITRAVKAAPSISVPLRPCHLELSTETRELQGDRGQCSSQHMGILGNQGNLNTVQPAGSAANADLPPGKIPWIREPMSDF